MTAPDDAERAAIVEEWRRRQEAWKPKESRGTGCLLVLAGLGLYFLVVGVAPHERPEWLRNVMMAVMLLLIAAGALLMVVRRIPYDPDELIESAIATLTGGAADAAARRQAAVALLFHYEDVQGPTSRTQFDAAQVRQRLGGVIGFVESVERVLREEKLSDAVFLKD